MQSEGVSGVIEETWEGPSGKRVWTLRKRRFRRGRRKGTTTPLLNPHGNPLLSGKKFLSTSRTDMSGNRVGRVRIFGSGVGTCTSYRVRGNPGSRTHSWLRCRRNQRRKIGTKGVRKYSRPKGTLVNEWSVNVCLKIESTNIKKPSLPRVVYCSSNSCY